MLNIQIRYVNHEICFKKFLSSSSTKIFSFGSNFCVHMTIISASRKLFKNYFKFLSTKSPSSFYTYVNDHCRSLKHSAVCNQYAISKAFLSNEGTIRVEFKDSLTVDFHCLWLRDSCSCQKCVHPVTRQKLFDPVALELNMTPKSCYVTETGELKIVWPEKSGGDHCSRFNPLRLFRLGIGIERNVCESIQNCFPPIDYWNGKKMEEKLPIIEYEDIMQELRGIHRCLENIHRLGIVVVKNAPCEPGEVVKVMNRITFVKNTRWGSSFHIADSSFFASNIPNLPCISNDLDFHTDMNYLEKSPGIKAVHCLDVENDTTLDFKCENSGRIYFVDGFHAAKWLKEIHPFYFETLASSPIRYRMFTSNMKYSTYQPLLTLDRSGNVTEIHFNNRLMAPFDGPNDSVLDFYASRKLFGEFLRKKENQFSLFLEPGDMVVLNNKRVLHAFDRKRVKRHLEGCFADMDDVIARYRSFLWEKYSIEEQ